MRNIKTYMQSLNEESDQEALNRAMRYSVVFAPIETVEELLDRGADVNSADPDDGSTALHKAAFTGNEEMARMLIGRGADPNREDRSRRTPLRRHLNASNDPPTEEEVAFTRFMLLNGADPFKAFVTPEEIVEYFGGDIDRIPERTRSAIKRMERGADLFGED